MKAKSDARSVIERLRKGGDERDGFGAKGILILGLGGIPCDST